jgi:hypothetical protein
MKLFMIVKPTGTASRLVDHCVEPHGPYPLNNFIPICSVFTSTLGRTAPFGFGRGSFQPDIQGMAPSAMPWSNINGTRIIGQQLVFCHSRQQRKHNLQAPAELLNNTTAQLTPKGAEPALWFLRCSGTLVGTFSKQLYVL